MVTVALAGATSGFGLTMLKTFLQLNKRSNGKHKPILLSRFPQPDVSDQDIEVRLARVREVVQQSGLEYTRFECGLFMSTLATGTPKDVTEVGIREGRQSGEEEALAGLRPWNFVINIRAGTADFAGDG
ncbi:hypothetical protein CERZMDRAFT_96812 [Cercospora zeae-maydis SCOH1-5]|uniref:NAD(P)-binding domain-containing protein n=1 Tax=Cercospora zeae-maydis SCOH1-5 TaxID=717836 RepID=A0A6A6FI94_9PEZI|nr:hypothetical protein CERZMDRAFT_96812 [Cercospora zeae-maydis SCOH1-5]